MKKVFALTAAAILSIGIAHAAIIFNPANSLNVVDEGGFTGSSSVVDPYSQAQVRFIFSGLNPSPLPASFQITNIFLKGDGITTSLSFADITITANGTTATSYQLLNTTLANVSLVNSLVSFTLPGGNVINDGAILSIAVRYQSGPPDFNNQVTSSSGPVFEAQNVGPEPIPEPGTWAAAALLVGGAAFMRWRRRQTA